jgi:hypothetical protein
VLSGTSPQVFTNPRPFFIQTPKPIQMFHIRQFSEEIHFYERQNEELEIEDLLRQIMDEKPMNEKKIKDNKKRIEKLEWEIIMLY